MAEKQEKEQQEKEKQEKEKKGVKFCEKNLRSEDATKTSALAKGRIEYLQ